METDVSWTIIKQPSVEVEYLDDDILISSKDSSNWLGGKMVKQKTRQEESDTEDCRLVKRHYVMASETFENLHKNFDITQWQWAEQRWSETYYDFQPDFPLLKSQCLLKNVSGHADQTWILYRFHSNEIQFEFSDKELLNGLVAFCNQSIMHESVENLKPILTVDHYKMTTLMDDCLLKITTRSNDHHGNSEPIYYCTIEKYCLSRDRSVDTFCKIEKVAKQFGLTTLDQYQLTE